MLEHKDKFRNIELKPTFSKCEVDDSTQILLNIGDSQSNIFSTGCQFNICSRKDKVQTQIFQSRSAVVCYL